MPGFSILRSSDAVERDRWLSVWRQWPEREVSAHPAYVELFCGPHDTATAACWEEGATAALFPFVHRRLAHLQWAQVHVNVAIATSVAAEAGPTDLTSPYGYGGAYWWGDCAPDASRFWRAFDAWARDERLVSAFARLSLDQAGILPFPGEVAEAGKNVVRTLTLGADETWMAYAHKVRKNVKRARARGLTVSVDESGARLDDFLAVYYQTMERREADRGYFFPREFFVKLRDELVGSFVFFHALSGDTVVSTELVLVSERTIYSFLGGTLADWFDARPNDLLKHAIIEWGREHGKATFVLGGGYRGEDGIFQYKRSFAPEGVVPFLVGRWILNPDEYARLIALRRAWESGQGRDWSPREDFFPQYRA